MIADLSHFLADAFPLESSDEAGDVVVAVLLIADCIQHHQTQHVYLTSLLTSKQSADFLD